MLYRRVNARLRWWFCVMMVLVNSTPVSTSVAGDGGTLIDPFLALTGAVTTAAVQRANKCDSACVSSGAIAGSIIGTLLISALIAFLTWLIYLRPKFQELRDQHLNSNHKRAYMQHPYPFSISSSWTPQRKKKPDDDRRGNPLPLDATALKFGTFPFRQSQISSINSHDNRRSSSFRSVNADQDCELIDVELLDPRFGGLNFSITGNMRAGIFVREILSKSFAHPPTKATSSNPLKIGDRIMALTVCFDSIVYEDALTILSYASPYPVVLRIQRSSNEAKVNTVAENRSIAANTPSKVKWRDDLDHYDNDTPLNHSFVQPNPPLPLLTPKHSRPPPPTPQNRSSSKKARPNASTQPRTNHKSASTYKGNRAKTPSNSVLATSGATAKRCSNHVRKYRSKIHDNQRTLANQMMMMSTGLTAKPLMKPATPLMHRKSVKTVTDAVLSYRRHKNDAAGMTEPAIDAIDNAETASMPYYDSPYDYFYDDLVPGPQYQYLHQSHMNIIGTNTLATESLTAITPNRPC